MRTESTQEEDNANASLPSIPETIDAVMPSIQEDGASDEEEQDDSEEKMIFKIIMAILIQSCQQ